MNLTDAQKLEKYRAIVSDAVDMLRETDSASFFYRDDAYAAMAGEKTRRMMMERGGDIEHKEWAES